MRLPRTLAALALPTTAVIAALTFLAPPPAQAAVPRAAAAGAWTPTSASVPAGASTPATARINATSCPAAGTCLAVGSFDIGANKHTYLLAERFAAGRWQNMPVPLPANAASSATGFSYLEAVSCAGPVSCVAVGNYTTSTGGTSGLIEVLAGTSWSAVQVATPSGAATGATSSALVTKVACPATGACVGVGYYKEGAGGYGALIVTQSGGSWTALAAPAPAGAATGAAATLSLYSLSCGTAGSCLAGGSFSLSGGGQGGLLETLSGGTWSVTVAPVPADAATGTKSSVEITSVSCAATGTCAAVGQYHTTAATTGALALTRTGTAWTAANPVPPDAATGGSANNNLASVVCTGLGTCVAAGGYVNAATHSQAMVAMLSGGVWTAAGAPVPVTATGGSGAYSTLNDLSCNGPGLCVAVGDFAYQGSSRGDRGLIEALSGGSWRATSSPLPSDAATGATSTSSLHAVSCVAGDCAAGGYYKDATGGFQGLLLTTGQAPSGYWEMARDGGIFAFTVPFLGSMGGKPLNQPIVGAAADPLTGGYYEVAKDGGIFAFTAPFKGSMGGKPLNQPIVGMAFDTRTGGYYLVASDGGIFAFTAPFKGSMGGKPLNQPIVGMAFDPATGGYWEVARDGGIFAFTAPFQGSMGGKPLNQPIVGMTMDSLTGGYYLVASDGGLFAFTAPFKGSMGGKPLNEPIVGMAFDYGTGGYWEVASDGGLFAFTAPFQGSMGGKPLNQPIVAMAVG